MAEREDLFLIEHLLSEEHLPSSDISTKLDHFFLASMGTELVGIGGLELHGSFALLRSLIIKEAFRNQGYGKDLTHNLIQHAAQYQIREVYLLTSNQEAFFSKIGFEKVERNQVPPEIQATTQFSSLCPASAICMKTTIDLFS